MPRALVDLASWQRGVEFAEGCGGEAVRSLGLGFGPYNSAEREARCAHAGFLGTIRNTGKRGANRWNSASGASLSIGTWALAFDARFK